MVAVAAMVGWLRWGADWVLVVVWISAAAVTWFVVPLHHDVAASAPAGDPRPRRQPRVRRRAGGDGGLGRARVAWASSWPGSSARSARRSGAGSTARGHAASGGHRPRPGGGDRHCRRCRRASSPSRCCALADVVRRATRIGRLARLRFGGDPWRADQAAARAGLALAGADPGAARRVPGRGPPAADGRTGQRTDVGASTRRHAGGARARAARRAGVRRAVAAHVRPSVRAPPRPPSRGAAHPVDVDDRHGAVRGSTPRCDGTGPAGRVDRRRRLGGTCADGASAPRPGAPQRRGRPARRRRARLGRPRRRRRGLRILCRPTRSATPWPRPSTTSQDAPDPPR